MDIDDKSDLSEEDIDNDEDWDDELGDEEVGDVSGGYIFHVGAKDTPDPQHRWEVIDDRTGDVLGRYATRKQAIQEAKMKGVKLSRIWRGGYLQKLRDAYRQHEKYKTIRPSQTDWEPPF